MNAACTPIPLTEAIDSHSLPPEVTTPSYDRSRLTVGIAHFGVGGFHRSHQAMYLDRLMECGEALDWAICGIGLMPGDTRMRDALLAQRGLYTLTLKRADGGLERQVVGSIIDYLYAPDDPEQVLQLLASPRLRIVSLTITEGGYNLSDLDGTFDAEAPAVAHDLAQPQAPQSVFGFIVEALSRRREAGIAPFTVMSCDNIEENGAVARSAMLGFARLRDAELADWIAVEVDFPNSMVDRITPMTTAQDIVELAEQCGVTDAWPVVAEPYAQWVIEDCFAKSGRPDFTAAGVQLTEDVRPYELLKLRVLNGGHQAIAYPGRLLGYELVDEAMRDELVLAFLDAYMSEVSPYLPNVPGMDLGEYRASVRERFANPRVSDTLLRLSMETSDRVPKFVLPVLTSGEGREFPVVMALLALWARFVRGIDERGAEMRIVDRRLETLRRASEGQAEDPLAFLRLRELFGGLAEQPALARAFATSWRVLEEEGVRALLRRVTSGEDKQQR